MEYLLYYDFQQNSFLYVKNNQDLLQDSSINGQVKLVATVPT